MRSFIPVHNILPCKAMLFSAPFTKQLITELKLLVINPPKEFFLVHRGALAGAEVSAGLKTSTGVSAAAPWFPLMQSTSKSSNPCSLGVPIFRDLI